MIIGFISYNVSASDISTVQFSPSNIFLSPGETFSVNVLCIPGQPMKSFEFKLSFDPSLLQVNSVTKGDIFNDYTTFFNSGTIDNNAGTVVDIYNLIIGEGNVSDSGTLVNIEFTIKDSTGVSTLDLYEVGITDENGYLPISVTDGSVTIQETDDENGSGGGGSSGGSGGGGGIIVNSSEEQNNPPETPTMPTGPIFIEMGVEYSYSSSSFDIDEDLIRLRFDWGDGSFSNWSDFVSSNSTVSMSHSWKSISTFEIRAIAQDYNMNSSWSSSTNVTVSQDLSGDIPPVLNVNFSINESDNSKVEFDASGSFDIDGNITSYYWDFGDGENDTGIAPTHIYMNSGSYKVTLSITNENDNIYERIIYVTVDLEVASDVDEESQKSDSLLLYFIGGVIGLVVILIIFLVVFFKVSIKSFVARYDHLFLRRRKLSNYAEKMEELDAKIEALRKSREVSDIEKSSTNIIDSSSVTLGEYDKVRLDVDFIIDSNSKEDKFNEDPLRDKIDKILEGKNYN
jgi:PKD repeat protein